MPHHFAGFPWLHSHGPIEAWCNAKKRTNVVLSFRGYTATAPLKHAIYVA